MLSLSPATRIFVAIAPVDIRRSFNGLYAHMQTVLSPEPSERPSFSVHQQAEKQAQDFIF